MAFSSAPGIRTGKIATASRPASPGKIEIVSANDFVLPSATILNSATFTGLLPTGQPLGDVTEVRVEIYRVFPSDWDVSRTSGPPLFLTDRVPTRD